MQTHDEERPASVEAESGAQTKTVQEAHRNYSAGREVLSSLIDAMRHAGAPPADPSEIVPDGTLRRYAVEGDKPGRRNGWYRVFNDDRPAGAFGSWRTGGTSTWSLHSGQTLSPADRKAMQRQAGEQRRRRAAEIAAQHNAARGRAVARWTLAWDAHPKHPYLVAKSIKPHGARQRDGWLVLPLYGFDFAIWSLQFIAANGAKRLLKGGRKAGCMIPIRGYLHAPSGRVLICEGFATGATLAEAEPAALVLAAVDAGNLRGVTIGARQRWPEAEIVVCADADDIGIGKAREAATVAGALLAVPEFPPGTEGSDFNDLAILRAQGVA